MKKLLLLITILAGFVAAAPRAEAGQYRKIYTPYGVQYVNKYSGYDSSYYDGNRYRNHRHYRSARHYRSYPVYRTSYRSYPVYRTSYRSYPRYSDYGSCHQSYGYSSRPRIAISFGF